MTDTTAEASFSVTDMSLLDITPNLRHFIDGSSVDVDGITATAEPHPAFDPDAGAAGEGALLVRFTDPTGRARVVEVEIHARWVEGSCDHERTTQSDLGTECTYCGLVLA